MTRVVMRNAVDIQRTQLDKEIPGQKKAAPGQGQTTLQFTMQPKAAPADSSKRGMVQGKLREVKECGKFYLHPKSLLNDPILQPRKLTNEEDIFDIVMPWLEDLEKEQKADKAELKELGLSIDEPDKRKQVKNNSNQMTLDFDPHGKKEKKGRKGKAQSEEAKQLVMRPCGKPALTKHQIFSHIIKHPCVQNFDWTITMDCMGKKGKLEQVRYPIRDIQAIYINPKWKQSRLGQRLTFDDETTQKMKERHRKGKKTRVKAKVVMKDEGGIEDEEAEPSEEKK